TRRSARLAARASVGPGAGCHCGTAGLRSVEEPLYAIARTTSRHVGRSVVSGATTPNRNGLAPPVAVVWVIVPILRIGPSLLPVPPPSTNGLRRFRQHRSK